MKISGVYAFTSPSGGQYVGSAVDLDKRRNEHLRALRRNGHCNRPPIEQLWPKARAA